MAKHHPDSPMRIRLSPERRATLLRAIKGHFADHFDEPLSDFRASREYRLLVAQNLLRKCFLEQHAPKTETRVTSYA